MKHLSLFFLITCELFLCLTVFADDFLETVPLAGNECLSSIAILNSGDVVAAGVDYTSGDILLLKLNSTGAVTKAQRISGSATDEAQAITATSDGGAVVVGSTNSFGVGNSDAFILKIRTSGTIAWKRFFGTSGNEHFVKIVQTRDRGFIALGDADHDPNLNDIVVAKFNQSGGSVWRKTISAAGFDHASDLSLTSDNGVIVTIASDFPGGVRSVLVKLSANGSVQWSRIYGSGGNHTGLSAFEAQDGGYYFTEIFTASGSQRSDTVLAKLDQAGIPVWSRIYKSPGSSLTASVTPIESTTNLLLAGNITTSAGANSRGILIGLNESGNVLWRKRIRPDSRPVFIARPVVARDASILVAGCSGTQTSNNMDSVVLKIQSNGTIQEGCSKLISFPLSNATFNLSSSEITLEQIPVPFFTGTAGFQVSTFLATESAVCSSE